MKTPSISGWSKLGLSLFAFGLLLQGAPIGFAQQAGRTSGLSSDERLRLWKLEESGARFEAETLGAFGEALKESEAPALAGLLAPSVGLWFGPPVERIKDTSSWVRGYRSPNLSLEISGFSWTEEGPKAAGIIGRLFTIHPSAENEVEVHLRSFSAKPNANSGKEWVGSFDLTIQSGPGLVPALERTIIHFETNSDGLIDQIRLDRPTLLRPGKDQPLFKDVAKERGLPVDDLHDNWKTPGRILLNTGGIYVEDWNRDGCLDLFLTDAAIPGGLAIYEGSPSGVFQERAIQDLGIQNFGTDILVTLIDFDNDGWVDLVHGPLLYRNEEGKRFQLMEESNLGTLLSEAVPIQAGSLVGLIPADYDGDGLVDLYATRISSTSHQDGALLEGKAGAEASNQLLRNLGGGQFEDRTTETATAATGLSSFTAAWLHANDDALPDLYVINEFGNGLLLLNEGPEKPFRSVTSTDTEGAGFGSMGLTIIPSLTGRGSSTPQIYVSSMYSHAGSRVTSSLLPQTFGPEVTKALQRMATGSEIYSLETKTQGVKPVLLPETGATEIGWAWGSAAGDFDHDGRLDLYVTSGFLSRDRDRPDT